MNCENCKKDIAQISLMEHEYCLYLQEQRENRLKLYLALSNIAWAIGTVIHFLVR